MPNAMGEIEHVVVLMFENRTLDNVLGWLYADQGNRPPRNLPDTGQPPTYDGLVEGTYWNPSNPLFLEDPSQDPRRVFVTRGTSAMDFPNPGPAEEFDRITFQLFGTNKPAKNQPPSMLGFLADYQRQVGPVAANALMQSYAPEQLPVLSALARSYAVSDRWFSAVPAQTWPNRSFMHSGTSEGHVNNWPLTPYDVKTVYQALEERQVSWGLYYTHFVPLFGAMAQLTMKQLRAQPLRKRVFPLATFLQQAHDGTLPEYSFIEPDFTSKAASDMHPPGDVGNGDRYLGQIFQALSQGKHWNSTLFIVTFDEGAGIYDHVPPPWGATPPDARSRPGDNFFGFDRFGCRVPALLISPWIEPGTVFRSPTAVPFDHTSILRTVRDWKGLPDDFLPSARVAQAPSFADVLSRASPRRDLPDFSSTARPMARMAVAAAARASLPRDAGLADDMQKSIVVAVERELRGQESNPDDSNILDSVRTHADVDAYLNEARARAFALGEPVPEQA